MHFHKNVARCQREAYNEHRTNINILRDKILIEFDFKQKIVIGLSPRQISEEYYNLIQRSCLGINLALHFLSFINFVKGFGIYYVENDRIEMINFDLITSDLEQDAHAAVRGLRVLREQEFFQQIDKNEYIVWSDTGKHFRNNEVMGYFLRELAEQKKHSKSNI